MTELLSKLNNEYRSHEIQWIFKAKKIANDINAYQKYDTAWENLISWLKILNSITIYFFNMLL